MYADFLNKSGLPGLPFVVLLHNLKRQALSSSSTHSQGSKDDNFGDTPVLHE